MSEFGIIKRNTQAGSEMGVRDGLPERRLEGSGLESGPVLLDITANSVEANVFVNPSALFASARIWTESKLDGVIDAVRRTRLELSGNVLTIDIPDFDVPPTVIHGRNGSRTVISGTASFIQVGGSVISGGATLNGDNNIKVEVTLPSDSGVRADLGSGVLKVRGDLVGVDAELSSGILKVDGSVNNVRASLSSGSFAVGRVTQGLEGTVSSGSLNIGEYTGSKAVLRASSGSINLNVGRAASGSVEVRVSSGNANLSGLRGRSREEGGDMDIRTRCSSGNINRF